MHLCVCMVRLNGLNYKIKTFYNKLPYMNNINALHTMGLDGLVYLKILLLRIGFWQDYDKYNI
jgi:hypothetical protein